MTDEDADRLDGIGPALQQEIYIEGEGPSVPLSAEELERQALDAMAADVRTFVEGGAGGGGTMRSNRRAFDRWQLVPRVLRDVAARDLSTEFLGRTLPAPVMLAPIGAQAIHHDDGELATARAAASLGIPYIVSTVSSRPLEEVAGAMGETPKLFQLYWGPDRELVESFVGRAEEAGYDALVVTVDMPLTGWRERDADEAALPPLRGEGLANYTTDPVFRAAVDQPLSDHPEQVVEQYLASFTDASLTWDDLAWLRERTDLPILLKGVLHPDDAVSALDHGVDGLVVSNHGGRQLDGAVGALQALPRIAEAVDGQVPVVFDSGIRRGPDALTALALGADAVAIGRPYIYGLALAGEDGVRDVLRNFLGDLDIGLGLAGYSDVADLDRAALWESTDGV
ncbi:alpha-hydroxy-acid oxidizing protein [Haloglomus litoreum]|uniref:alpha-hydroxy-acid oxidizing protein n=1 Tax=Haloglomus litoreum TaxID=3034026 RepID=UPI0023E7ACDD|nr:alpha-hydroxy-acid oxidizing protein [Haloglomus sp. DT116]